MPAILMSLAKVPVKLLNTPFQGTRTTAFNWLFFAFGETEPVSLPVLEPSWSLDRLFPTADTPGKGYSAD